MRFRVLAGAAGFGLLASLMAHAAAFGGGHAMGGAYHGALIGGAALTAVAVLVGALSLAWGTAARTLDGTVIASRLRSSLPSWACVATSAALWLALGEGIEPAHPGNEASPALLAAAVVLAAWAVLLCARLVIAFLTAVVIAIRAARFSQRIFDRDHLLRIFIPICRRQPRSRRRYARPPPIATGA